MAHSFINNLSVLIHTCTALVLLSLSAPAQWTPTPNDTLTSIRVQPDKRVIFRIYAPQADKVLLLGTDIPGNHQGMAMSQTGNGVWQVAAGPLPPGSYRYLFNVDGVGVIDPRNPLTSQSNMNSWSLLHVAGAEFMDTQDVPRGAVSEVTYYSTSLKRFRRMHVYTPPGYEKGKDQYPVLYLLHGALDCDDSWTSVGRAGFILDNLLAEKKAQPMVVVMPAGHTGPFRFGEPLPEVDEFVVDFTTDIVPAVEKRYRVYTDRQHRAIAGLSMGGGHTLNIAIPALEKYAYIGVFSSGIFGIAGGFGAESGMQWEERHLVELDDAAAKKDLRLIWFATGREDFLLETSRATVAMLRKHGFEVIYKETPGGHTWHNWREYLYEFAQEVFR